RPGEVPFDLTAMASATGELFEAFREKSGYRPNLYMESGRYITGPHGVLVTRAINRKEIYRRYIGVDACMSSLMRPAMYGAYHHITIPSKVNGRRKITVDVVGSLCENNDKFAIQRELPPVEMGDLLIIHDTGAHGHAMGFNYNGRLQPKELLLRSDGTVELIRREESVADYLATQEFPPEVLSIP
ncbi:MAG: diaminopimelate decarboxylase, partial [Desulfobacterales bacterium]